MLHLQFLFTPLPALLNPRAVVAVFGVEGVFFERFAGEVRAQTAMLKLLTLAASFNFALAPGCRLNVNAAGAVKAVGFFTDLRITNNPAS